jgi:hypothetical protein
LDGKGLAVERIRACKAEISNTMDGGNVDAEAVRGDSCIKKD